MTDPVLPRLLPRELRPAAGAKRWEKARASGSSAEWWQACSGESSSTEPGVGVWSTLPHLPALRMVPQRAAPNRTELRSPLLRPLIPDESQYQRGVPEHYQHPQCLNCSFLPDLRSQTSHFQNNPKEILLHQIPTLGPVGRDHAQLTTIKKANKAHDIQALKLKAMFTHSSSGEGSGHRRQYCPFRVHFADETRQDIELRYWERSCAFQQGIENGPATQSAASERVFDSVGRWLESLPQTPYPRAEEEAVASSPFSWDFPGRPTPELQGHLSEDTFMKSSLRFIPNATTQRQQTDLKTFLGTHGTLEQVDKLPCPRNQKLESFLPRLLLQKFLKRLHPKGHQPLLPSVTRQQAQQ